MIFHVYVDWTNEDPPRPFYVGKGSPKRVKTLERNIVWERTAAKHGHHRVVTMSTKDEAYAFEIEQLFIAQHGTCHGWGANLTEGGEGAAGAKRTEAFKEARRGSNNPMYGKSAVRGRKHTPEALAKFRLPKSEETKARMKEAQRRRAESGHTQALSWLGRKHTEQSRVKMRESWYRRQAAEHAKNTSFDASSDVASDKTPSSCA